MVAVVGAGHMDGIMNNWPRIVDPKEVEELLK